MPFEDSPADRVNLNHVTDSNSRAAIYKTGRIGKARDTSAGQVDLGHHPKYNISGDFALSLWVQNRSPLGSGPPFTLFGVTDKGVFDPTTGALRVQIETATSTHTETTSAGILPEDDQRHHVVIDYDEPADARLRIVLDGAVVHDASGVLAPDGSTVDLTTADTWQGSVRWGRPGETILFDRNLTHWEILSRSRDTTIAEQPPLGWDGCRAFVRALPLILLERSDTDPYGLQRWNESPNADHAEDHGFTGQEKEADLGLYYYGARYYFPEVGRFLSNDPMREFLNPYSYVGNNSIISNDPYGKDSVVVIFPDFKIITPMGRVPFLGHAGVLMIDNNTGRTAYFEYGRYDQEKLGEVRRRSVPNVKINKDTGEPTVESLHAVFRHLSNVAGQGGDVVGIYVSNDNFDKMLDHAKERMSQNSNPEREAYDLILNNCFNFAAECANQDKKWGRLNISSPVPLSSFSIWVSELRRYVSYESENSEIYFRPTMTQLLQSIFPKSSEKRTYSSENIDNNRSDDDDQ